MPFCSMLFISHPDSPASLQNHQPCPGSPSGLHFWAPCDFQLPAKAVVCWRFYMKAAEQMPFTFASIRNPGEKISSANNWVTFAATSNLTRQLSSLARSRSTKQWRSLYKGTRFVYYHRVSPDASPFKLSVHPFFFPPCCLQAFSPSWLKIKTQSSTHRGEKPSACLEARGNAWCSKHSWLCGHREGMWEDLRSGQGKVVGCSS